MLCKIDYIYMIMQELIKLTEHDHPEYSILCKALEVMTSVTLKVNELEKRKDVGSCKTKRFWVSLVVD